MTQCTSHDDLDRLRPLLSTRTQSPHLPPQEQVLTGLLSSSRAVTIAKPESGPNWQMFMDYLLELIQSWMKMAWHSLSGPEFKIECLHMPASH